MNSKQINNYKKDLELNQEQKSLIFGKLLGDGHLETQNNGRTYRLKIEHSLKQKDYVLWIINVLKPWITSDFYTKNNSYGLKCVGCRTY